jgi:predicted transcriptional regulator YheO
VLKRLAVALHRLFAPLCEVVIHDFRDLEHSIVHAEGTVTGRSVGGAATDLLLCRVRSGQTGEDLHNYRTVLDDGRVMKSSTIFLRDAEGRTTGAFCVNYDISAILNLEEMIRSILGQTENDAIEESFTDDLAQTVRKALLKAQRQLGINPMSMSRADKVDLMMELDLRGIFLVRRAVPIVAEQLGLSRATVYNYLKEARETDRSVDGVAGEGGAT